MASLYEIDRDLEQLLNEGFIYNEETGEIDTTLDEQKLLDMLDKKFEDYGLYIKNLKSDVDAIDKEIKRLQARKKAKKRLSERLNDTLLIFMQKHDKRRLETPKLEIRLRTTKRVIVDDEESAVEFAVKNKLEDCYTFEIKSRINKLGVKKHMEEFKEYAHIEDNTTLNIK